MLQWHTKGSWSHRAYWGENLIDWGKDGTPERLRLGDLPAADKWVRLEVPVAKLKLAPGTVIDGWAFTQYGGTVYWDKAGIETETPQDGQLFDSLSAWVRAAACRQACGLAREYEEDRRARAIEANAKPRPRSCAPTSSSMLYAKTAKAIEPLASEARASRDGIAKSSRTRSRPRWSFAKRPASPSRRSCSSGANMTSAVRKSSAGVPAFLPPLPPGAPVNRLGLAQWLIAPNHPLTARVAVNRFWLQVFGTGIVKTAEDFGAQGEPPSHPELLDWLAVQFREDGWDVKRFMKRLVMSAAYRQSSRVTPESLAKDPANRLLARGPRFRLDAETLRDQALFASGLLIETVGGPSVKPPQPFGLWEAVAYTDSNTAHFKADTGAEKVHRRSFYTFWKRTSPPPQMTTFDAPSREACQVRRERTNTPLQALLLMNEPQFIEAARGLAERTLARRRLDGRRPPDLHVPAGDRPIARRQGPGRAELGAQGPDGPLHQRARGRQAVDRDRRDQARPALSTRPSWRPGR